MTKKEYQEYRESVAEFQSTGVYHLCIKEGENYSPEGYYSTCPCECCRTNEPGTRYDCDTFNQLTREIEEYTVCEDCVYCMEYGTLDDMTMESLTE